MKKDLLEKLEILVFKEELSKTITGNIIVFGNYEQDNNPDNGKEPIEWIVLNNMRTEYMTLISNYILDVQLFNTEHDDTVWENSDLRLWLNEDFFNTAFTPEDQAYMDTILLNNPDDAWSTDNGSDTTDYVFILNTYEKQDWNFTNNAPTTLYAQSLGLDAEAPWVLRTINKRDAYDCNIVIMSNNDTAHF